MNRYMWLLLVFVIGCASAQRDCASCNASTYGADWIIVQYRFDGEPTNCWQLTNVAVENESQTDGIYWQDPGGHLVHLSDWYNRVQVSHSDFAGGAKTLGVDPARCVGGRYAVAKDAGGE